MVYMPMLVNGGLTVIQVYETYSENNFNITLQLTGQQGNVMKESIHCAVSTHGM